MGVLGVSKSFLGAAKVVLGFTKDFLGVSQVFANHPQHTQNSQTQAARQSFKKMQGFHMPGGKFMMLWGFQKTILLGGFFSLSKNLPSFGVVFPKRGLEKNLTYSVSLVQKV